MFSGGLSEEICLPFLAMADINLPIPSNEAEATSPYTKELKQQQRRQLRKHQIIKKWIRAASNFIALLLSRSNRQMLVIFSGVEFLKTVSKFRKRKRKSLSCRSRPQQNMNLGIFTSLATAVASGAVTDKTRRNASSYGLSKEIIVVVFLFLSIHLYLLHFFQRTATKRTSKLTTNQSRLKWSTRRET